MTYRSFSKRQLLAMTWWNKPGFCDRDGIICDGAVRSGKTLALCCGFFLWSMTCFDKSVFAVCGKTVSSLRRNIILQLPQWLGGLLTVTEHRQENKLTVRMGGRVNTYYLFGGQDEGSYMLIQGMTLAGVLLDEAVLMPRSFVEQAAARCSVPGSKLWFSCNPGGQEHWFYREWICKAGDKNMLYLHFTMDDNPGLSPDIRARYDRLYTGMFYQRYVLGRWCRAEGLVYEFDPERHVGQVEIKPGGRWYISVDYGTRNPFSAGLWYVTERERIATAAEQPRNDREKTLSFRATGGSRGIYAPKELVAERSLGCARDDNGGGASIPGKAGCDGRGAGSVAHCPAALPPRNDGLGGPGGRAMLAPTGKMERNVGGGALDAPLYRFCGPPRRWPLQKGEDVADGRKVNHPYEGTVAGSEGSAAGGGYSDLSEWQRSAGDAAACRQGNCRVPQQDVGPYGGTVAVRVREFYYDGRQKGRMMTDEEYHDALEALAGDLPVEYVIIDPSAASFIALLRKRRRFRVRRANNGVLPGIRLVGSLLQQGRLLFDPSCADTIREFSLYCWEEDESRDAPRKENDHAMDDIRYFAMSVMK